MKRLDPTSKRQAEKAELARLRDERRCDPGNHDLRFSIAHIASRVERRPA